MRAEHLYNISHEQSIQYRRALSIPLNTRAWFAIYLVLSPRFVAICGRENHISNGPVSSRPPVLRPGVHYYIAESRSYFGIQGPLSPPILGPLWLDHAMMDDRASSSAPGRFPTGCSSDASCVW